MAEGARGSNPRTAAEGLNSRNGQQQAGAGSANVGREFGGGVSEGNLNGGGDREHVTFVDGVIGGKKRSKVGDGGGEGRGEDVPRNERLNFGLGDL